MSAPKQWLVIPKFADVRAYVTESEAVAMKRVKKGDVVEEILREPDHRPHPDGKLPEDEEEL